MHRTLKRRAVKPVRRTCAGQQRQFDVFRTEYNTERPHNALGGGHAGLALCAVAASVSGAASDPRVPGHFLVKRVTEARTFRFQQRLLSIANALVHQHIGLEETDGGVWAMSSDTFVTYLSGCSGGSASDRAASGR